MRTCVCWGQKWVVGRWHKEKEKELVSSPETGSPDYFAKYYQERPRANGSQRRLKPGGDQVPPTLFFHNSSRFLRPTGVSY